MKIRHFGLLGNSNNPKKLILFKTLTNTKVLTKENFWKRCQVMISLRYWAFNKTKSSIIIYNFIPSQNCFFIGEGKPMSILLKFYRNFNLEIDIFRKV